MTEPLFGVHREPSLLGPGSVHVPDWMSREQQEYLLRACADWAAVAAPRSIVLPGGGRMSVRTFSLGRHWSPYRYDDDDAATPPIPDWLVRAARTALTSAAAIDPRAAVLNGRRNYVCKHKLDGGFPEEDDDDLVARSDVELDVEEDLEDVADVGADAEHPTLCGRCISNLYGAGETRTVA